jgi:5-methyltetrahydropteroyltriglutamate--homocysteine methyltransferase
MLKTTTIGFSQVGQNNEYKKALNAYLTGQIDETALYARGHDIRKSNLKIQSMAGIDIIGCNDFSWHDDVWDTSLLIGNIPSRYYWEGGEVPLDIYFTPKHGQKKDKFEVMAMEQRPFFNTKTYYTVPEFQDGIHFIQSDSKPVQHYIEATEIIKNPIRPILFGPVSYVLLGKVYDSEDKKFVKIDQNEFLDEIVDVYKNVFSNLKRIKCTQIQINEPCLSTTISRSTQDMFIRVYEKIKAIAAGMEITLFTGFSDIGHNENFVLSMPVDRIHLNIAKSSNERIDHLVEKFEHKKISLGLIDGDNVFSADINRCCKIVEKFSKKTNDIHISTSTSLAFCPFDIRDEKFIPEKLRPHLKFSIQKLDELKEILDVSNGSKKYQSTNVPSISENFKKSETTTDYEYTRDMRNERNAKNKKLNQRSIFPMTTIGCFGSQTIKQKSNKDKTFAFLDSQIEYEFDILSTGEFDRNSTCDIEYWTKFATGDVYVTTNNKIKTYFNEIEPCVIIYGDFALDENKVEEILEKTKETVLTAKNENITQPLKYRVTGPITATNRSFYPALDVDQYKTHIISNFAKFTKSIIDKTIESGIRVIQIDENDMFQDGDEIDHTKTFIKYLYHDLPTEIETHIYIKNADITNYLSDLDQLDADLMIFESARSTHDIIGNISSYRYNGNIAIGLYDPTSYHIPSTKDMHDTLKLAIRSFDFDKIWITYDSLFKSSQIDTEQGFKNLIEAVKICRQKYSKFSD